MPEHARTCPSCGNTISYQKYSAFSQARRRNSNCWPCRNEKMKGDGNHFYGKRHTSETKEKMRAADQSYKKSEKFKGAVRRGMVGKKCGGDIRLVWASLPPEEAANKYRNWVAKQSAATSGKNNPMYGRPSPQGAGNGWSGWYKGWYFRSLRELSYVVKVLEAGGLSWRSAETNDLRVEYIDPLGASRSYHPDFLVEEKLLVECKPKRLWNTPLVIAKSKAAKERATALGLEYVLIDPERLTDEELRRLHDAGDLKFTDRYERLYQERYANSR